MTGSEHFRRAEELAAKANEYLGQGDGQDTAVATALNVPHPQGGMENHDSMAWFKAASAWRKR